jgi:DNA-binding response OmpR family regulator
MNGGAMMTQEPLVVVADDDPGTLRLVSQNLQMEDFRVMTAADGKEAVKLVRDVQPTLALLDIGMPVMDGFKACERIREFSEVPIIMLAASGSVEDVVRGLDTGADDYIVKPFSVNELVARVKAVLYRTRFPQEVPQSTFVSGDLRIDFSQHQVEIADKEILLTPTEYRVLCLLARNAGKILTYQQILTGVWGEEYRSDTRVLQVLMGRLRKRLGDSADMPKYIATRPGVGYAFNKPKTESPDGTMVRSGAQ